MEKPLYYTDYLRLDAILESQRPVSFEPGHQAAHDEMLFIIMHQSYELWFKQILFELDYVLSVFRKEKINDNSEDMNLVLHRLRRVHKIMEQLNGQVTVLDTMTPLDFLEFRNLLTPASGFQSVQFRLIEATLGLDMEKRFQHDYYKRTGEGGFSKKDFERINKTEGQKSLLKLINGWLERMPFFQLEHWSSYIPRHDAGGPHPFWSDYREIYRSGLTEREAGKIGDFDRIFLELIPAGGNEADAQGPRQTMSPGAMRSALFIMLYRDFPVFRHSFQVLDVLVEIDNALAAWRHAHFRMVRRMIGMRVGTGNTTGSGYLEGAAASNYIFRDIAGLSTFLIERKKLPVLPLELIRRLSFQE